METYGVTEKKYTEEELDERSEKVIKLERFNLFSVGAWIHGRIYLEIDDYKNTSDLDNRQDPAAVILVRGYDYAKTLSWGFPEIKETIEVLNR